MLFCAYYITTRKKNVILTNNFVYTYKLHLQNILVHEG